MSHFSTIKLQFKNGHLLQQTLEEMGYTVTPNTVIRGYRGNTTTAEYIIRQDNGFDIGFRWNQETYEMVTDLWGISLDLEQLQQQLAQKYAHKTLLTEIDRQGFDLETEEVLEDGTIRIIIGRWQ